jgi:hypothetical protein
MRTGTAPKDVGFMTTSSSVGARYVAREGGFNKKANWRPGRSGVLSPMGRAAIAFVSVPQIEPPAGTPVLRHAATSPSRNGVEAFSSIVFFADGLPGQKSLLFGDGYRRNVPANPFEKEVG